LNEVFCNRVDFLITEDRKIHRKAQELGIDSKIFTIDSFLEKVIAENPSLVEYKVSTIKKEYFGNLDITDDFFDSLKSDYGGFEQWFAKKSDQLAYVCSSSNKITAFLYLKKEDENEPYPDISPAFQKKKRLKVGTFKVQLNGLKLGERFIKIIFDNALNFSVPEIYVTMFDKRLEQKRLANLLQEYGFVFYGIKKTATGDEQVYTRNFSSIASIKFPKLTYPFISAKGRKFLVPIYPEYHTSLFPDSILSNESPEAFIDNEPFRNAISKVYVSRSLNRDIKTGDILIFYRTGGYYKSVITTLGLVESIITQINDSNQFIALCRKRSVFSDDALKTEWNRSIYRPFLTNFLYLYAFPKRINMKRLIELGIIRDSESAPRGFVEISDDDFQKIIKETGTNERIIVH
jgi:hypothetical protein